MCLKHVIGNYFCIKHAPNAYGARIERSEIARHRGVSSQSEIDAGKLHDAYGARIERSEIARHRGISSQSEIDAGKCA